MSRSTKQIRKSIASFLGNAAKQWDGAAKLSREVCQHAWKHGDSSLVVELDLAFQEVNRNMFRAFRIMVSNTTPVILKKDASEDGHGTMSKPKRRKLEKAAEYADVIAAVETGDNLRAFLPAPKASKPKAKATVVTKLHAVSEMLEKDESIASVDLKAAQALLDSLQKEITARLKKDLGLEGGVEKMEPLADAV